MTRPMILLFVALFNSILGLSILFPVLPPLGRELGLSELEIGSLSTSYALMQALSSAYWGRQSEHRGRKPILLIGIIGFGLSFMAMGWIAKAGLDGTFGHVEIYVSLLLSRIIGGTFSSATIPSAQALAADLTERDDRTSAMALIGAAFGLGIVFGPAIGVGISWITGSLLAPLFFSAAIAGLNAFFVWTSLHEPERHRVSTPPLTTGPLLRKVWPLLLVGLTATLASVSLEQTVAFCFQDRLRVDAQQTVQLVGLALVFYGLVALVTQGFLVRRKRWKPRTLLLFGLPIAFCGYVVFTLAQTFPWLLIGLLIQGFGQGLLFPAFTSALSLAVDDHNQGSVAGLNSASQGIGRTLGPVIGTGLYGIANPLPYAFSAILIGIVFVVVVAAPTLATDQEEKTPISPHQQ